MSADARQDDSDRDGISTAGPATATGRDPDPTPSQGEDEDGSREGCAGSVASPQQRAANQANALRSTGPQTQAGKARVSQNAIKHGLQGRFQLIAGEDRAEYQAFYDALHRQLVPCGAMEEVLAERVIAGFWRLRRIGRMETEMIDKVLEDAWREKKSRTYHPKKERIDGIFGTALASPEHDLNTISLGEAVTRQIQSSDVIGKLHRYEAHMERGLYRALHELQRLQATRQGQAVPAPIALDITTDPNPDG